MLCSKIPVTYGQHGHPVIKLFTYFHSLMTYRIIFWETHLTARGYLHYRKKLLESLWAQNLKLLVETYLRCYRSYYFHANIYSHYLNFVINNLGHFQTNSATHCVNTRNKHHLHRPTSKLTCFQKSTYNSGIKISNNLPASLKSLMNEKAGFNIALKQYLNTHLFYSVDEFLLPKMETAS
jgi:hypothetical protein